MIGALKGTVLSKTRNPIILLVGGVGYAVYVAPALWSKLRSGDNTMLYTYLHIREDTQDLYGFTQLQELELFEMLQTVSGIGPRTALTIVDRGTTSIQKAVAASDVDFFTTIPRLGKKNAQKIIIELKSKLGVGGQLNLAEETIGETKEILEALISMGFNRREALEAVKKLGDENKTLEQKIRQALRLLAKP